MAGETGKFGLDQILDNPTKRERIFKYSCVHFDSHDGGGVLQGLQ